MNHPNVKSTASDARNATAQEQRVQKIGVVGLGYVGLPLAVSLDRHFDLVGFDIKEPRIYELREHRDATDEVSEADLSASRILFSAEENSLSDCDLLIVTVPTPIDESNQPDLSPLEGACRLVGRQMKPGAIVVFESTVYPGVTEEVCVPILEAVSGMKWKEHFFVGYSPERINPGDKQRTVDKIIKVVAGDTPETAHCLEQVYGSIITAGVHVAESIKVAEAAKVIENTQRDLNIALMNELAIIFGRLGISTQQVLKAAGTKWNFLPFTPGLVGGHCIGVDPFYLTHRAERSGYYPQMILAGRRINDGMGEYVANKTMKLLSQGSVLSKGARILVLGMTFKENVPDIRNSKVIDVIRGLQEYEADVDVFDPHADAEEVRHEFGIELLGDYRQNAPYDAVILAVPHDEFREQIDLEAIKSISTPKPVLVDIKWMFDQHEAVRNNIVHWQL